MSNLFATNARKENKQMFMFIVNDIVTTKDISGATYRGRILELDGFGFAVVSFGNVSESRIHISQLTKENI
jgi:ribosomal protein S1